MARIPRNFETSACSFIQRIKQPVAQVKLQKLLCECHHKNIGDECIVQCASGRLLKYFNVRKNSIPRNESVEEPHLSCCPMVHQKMLWKEKAPRQRSKEGDDC